MRTLRWAERLLVIAGVAMLAWGALLVMEAHIAQRVARRAIESAAHTATTIVVPGSEGTAGVAAPPPIVSRGSAVADLSIPRVRLSAIVLHGSDDRTLRRGPGHLENTAFPGEAGNVVIAGHRDSFFRPLQHVKLGDDVFVATPRGRFRYRVTSTRVVKSRDLSVLAPTKDPTLTLITCYPFWVLGDAPDRFVVRAAHVAEPGSSALAMPPPRPPEPVPVPVRRPPPKADDDTLVRQAVERYRAARGAPFRFDRCGVTISGNEAVAACRASARGTEAGAPLARTFLLERSGGGWAIRTIEVR